MTVKVDRRVRRTRRLLSEAFIELVVERGYDAVRIEDILERADIARTTFYAHFSDKRDLLQHVAEIFHSNSQERLPDIQFDEQGLPTTAQLVKTFTNIKKHANFFRMVLNANGVPLLYDQVHQIIVDMIETTLAKHAEETGIQPIIPASLKAHHFAGSLLSSAKWWLQGQHIHLISPEQMAVLFIQLQQSTLLMA